MPAPTLRRLVETDPVTPETVTLPRNIYWADEFWTPVTQLVDHSRSGSAHVEYWEKTAGRPITLRPMNDQSAFTARADAETLNAWSQVAGIPLELTLRGVVRAVYFRHDPKPISVRPVTFVPAPDGDDYLLLDLLLIEA